MPKLQHLLFYLKTLGLVLVLAAIFNPAQAQVPDTVYTKPELNQGLPPATPQPVIVKPAPAPRPINVDSLNRAAREARQKQRDERPPLRKRFFTGGSLYPRFGYLTVIQVSPILGYRLSERFTLGTGLSYLFVTDGFDQLHFFGGRVFGQAMVYKSFFAHLEYEVPDFKDTYQVYVGGAGYRQMFNDRFGMDTMVLLDLGNNARSYYRNPIFRVNFVINL